MKYYSILAYSTWGDIIVRNAIASDISTAVAIFEEAYCGYTVIMVSQIC